jgi:hypothetical protein
MADRLRHGAILIATLCILLIDCFLANQTLAAEASGLLDGKSFVGNNGEKGRELDPDEHEEIIFENGRFRSVSCDPYNFGDSEYSTTVVGKIIHFEAETTSPSHGKIVWEGTVNGDTALVTFVWTKERWYWDTRREYWFKGKLNE